MSPSLDNFEGLCKKQWPINMLNITICKRREEKERKDERNCFFVLNPTSHNCTVVLYYAQTNNVHYKLAKLQCSFIKYEYLLIQISGTSIIKSSFQYFSQSVTCPPD